MGKLWQSLWLEKEENVAPPPRAATAPAHRRDAGATREIFRAEEIAKGGMRYAFPPYGLLKPGIFSRFINGGLGGDFISSGKSS
jgi:hypothetical protein